MTHPSPTPPEYVTREQRIVEDVHSDYQHIVVAHDPDYGHVLYLDDDLQIAESDGAYNTAMVDPLARAGCLNRVLILGGGDGGVLNAAVAAGAREATLVDIDARVLEIAQRYLPELCGQAFHAPGARVVTGDALAWLDASRGYDGICYDLTMEPVRAGQSRLAFIEEITDRIARSLGDGGMLTMQCCSEHQPQLRDEIHSALMRHFRSVSDRPVVVPSYHERWIFAAARYPLRSE